MLPGSFIVVNLCPLSGTRNGHTRRLRRPVTTWSSSSRSGIVIRHRTLLRCVRSSFPVSGPTGPPLAGTRAVVLGGGRTGSVSHPYSRTKLVSASRDGTKRGLIVSGQGGVNVVVVALENTCHTAGDSCCRSGLSEGGNTTTAAAYSGVQFCQGCDQLSLSQPWGGLRGPHVAENEQVREAIRGGP